MEDLEKDHENQFSNAQTELKKEMAMLHKKIMMETVSHDLITFRIEKRLM